MFHSPHLLCPKCHTNVTVDIGAALLRAMTKSSTGPEGPHQINVVWPKVPLGIAVALDNGTPHGGQVPPPKPGRFFFAFLPSSTSS